MPTPVSLATETDVWYRAVTLSERLAIRSPAAVSISPEPIVQAETDVLRRLEYCIAAWKSQRPFSRAELFQHRLNLDNLTEGDLRRLICEPVAEMRTRLSSAPTWMASVESALSSTPTLEFRGFLSNRMKRDPLTGFLDAAAPFITLGLSRLETGAQLLARRVAVCPF